MKLVLLLTLISQAAPLFRASARRVFVDVFVSNKGRPVSGLTADDFQILDNGEPKRGSYC